MSIVYIYAGIIWFCDLRLKTNKNRLLISKDNLLHSVFLQIIK